MIKELPEPTALQALQKFASIDTKTMRSKNVSVAETVVWVGVFVSFD
jgi:hypothetical protein